MRNLKVALAAACAVVVFGFANALADAPALLYWRGGTSALASESTNWATDPEGTVSERAPQNGDAIVLDATDKPMTWDLDDVTLASWTQTADYTGTVTFMTGPLHEGEREGLGVRHGVLSSDGKRRELIVTGDITLNGGTWTHAATPSLKNTDAAWTTGEGVFRLIARAGGDFVIGAGASIVARNGFRAEQGPGFARGADKDRMGAAHGGSGGNLTQSDKYPYQPLTYGSIRAPVTQGSGSACSGGGVIEVSAVREFTLDGSLDTSVIDSSNWYSGSGGSIFVKAATFRGGGSLKADTRTLGYCGGGGRIAVVLNGVGATFDGFTGTFSCIGNKAASHAGTVYKETPADREDGGVLEITGADITAISNARGHYTLLQAGEESLSFASIRLSKQVDLGIGPGAVVTTKELVSDGTKNMISLVGGTMVVPNDTTFSSISLRQQFETSVLTTTDGEAGTFAFANGVTFTVESDMSFAGTLRMLSGSKISQPANGNDDLGYRANFSADNFILDSGASVDVSTKGFSKAHGDGRPTDESKLSRAGSHGGLAMDVGSATTYGSITRPVTLGSGGLDGAGGGATHIRVKGKTVIDGTVTASGDVWYYGGAGGSIWIETGSLEGAQSGVIAADARFSGPSNTKADYCGGGGRVAVTLTDAGADFSKYLGVMRANGASQTYKSAKYAGGNGTVYLRKGGEAETDGTLLVDGQGCANADNYTDISSAVTETLVGNVVVTNNGNLRVRKGVELDVRKSLSNFSANAGGRVNGEPGDDDLAPGAVAFVDPTVESFVTGTNLFMCLKCAAPGKTVRFGSAADTWTGVVAGGILSIAGTETTPVYLRGLADGTAWLFDFHGKTSVAYADVKDSDASAGDKVSVDDTNINSGNNENWGFVGIKIGDTNVWYGTQGSSWSAAGNWSLERAPVDTDVIVISAEAACSPELAEALTLNRLEIAAGKSLTLNGFSLTVTNGVECLGAIVCTGSEVVTLDGNVTLKGFAAANSTLVLADTRSRTVDLGGQVFNLISMTGAEPTLSFSDGFSAFKLNITCTAAKSVVFVADRTVTAGEFFFSGIVGGEPALTLMSNASGEGWNLKVTGKGSGSGVIVRDSHAIGQQVFAYNPSTRGDNVTGWVFGISESTWIGGASGEWGNPENWSGNVVPGSDSCVHFTSDATVTLDVDDATAQILDVANCTLNLKGAKTLTVKTLLEILDGGTFCQAEAGNYVHVEGSAYVRSGGVWTHAKNGSGAADLGYGVKAQVDGNLTIDQNGKVTAFGCGYGVKLGPGAALSHHAIGASHGARMSISTSKTYDALACYGSMYRPNDLGSGGWYTAGGGRILLNVRGTLDVSGSIDASGPSGDWCNPSGGSVQLTCGELTGSGIVQANGANTKSNQPGCGGRVAVYQTVATDFSAFAAGTISAFGGVSDTTVGLEPFDNCGTVYLQSAGEEEGAGTVYIRNARTSICDNAKTGGVDLPVTNVCPDKVSAYRDTTFDLADGGVLFITRDVTIGELELVKPCRVNLNGHTLTIRSWQHKKCKGWPANWRTGIVYPGTDAAGNPGQIVWAPRPLTLIIR